LFYHLKLRSYVVVDIKTIPFEPEFAGKMNFYCLFRSRNNKYYSEFLIMPSAVRRGPAHRNPHAEFFCSSP
jgi:hypothetical protein